MSDLRPLLAAGDAPMVLAAGPRPLLDGSVRPLCRGLFLAAALSLPAFGPLAVQHMTARDTGPEATRTAVALPFPPSGGAAARLDRPQGGAR